MAGWAARLHSRTTTAERALERVKSGQRVFVQGASATPHILIAALVDRAPALRDVRIAHLHTHGEARYAAPGMEQSFRHESLFTAANVRAAVNEGRADYIPVFLSEVPILFEAGRLPLDVALLHVSPPDAHGFCSLGVSVDVALSAARVARTVIAQINPRMPRTLGDAFIHADRIDCAVEVDAPLDQIAPVPPTREEQRIGELVAGFVEDGATLQLGIGSIPNAVLSALRDRRDLGIHTEMFSDGVVDLVEAGVVSGALNPLHPGKIVTAFLMGSQRLYDFVHDNPQVEMHPVNYTNDTAVIRRNHKMVAINSAIEVDLTGQVVSYSIGSRVYSGVGGQVDFIRGAALARDGCPIIALPATALGGRTSRIVAQIHEGAMVTLTQAHVHFVVTEYGIAELYGKSLRERAQSLIRIAHPDFRDDLEAVARQRFKLWV
jgi:acyl-CoA hydrolase